MKFRSILLFLFLYSFSYAQEISVGKQVLNRFEQPNKIKWIKHFKGRIDDLNDIALTLGYDGSQYIGQMRYLRSQDTFWWEGEFKDGMIQLEEYKASEEPCGYIYGQLKEDQFIAEWSNYNNSSSAQMILQEVDVPAEMPTYCGDNKWIATFAGNYMSREIALILQNDLNDLIHGTIYMGIEGQTFQLRGSVTNTNGRFQVSMTDDLGHMRGYLIGQYEDQDRLYLQWQGPSHETVTLRLNRKHAIQVGCRAYADFSSSYDILYPKTTSSAYNRWINRTVDDWTRSCRQYALQVQQKNPAKKVSLRSSLRANAWCDLEQYSKEIISGYMIFSNTWSVDMEAKAFNFDIKANKWITLDDVFQEGVNVKQLIREQLNKQMEQHAFYSDPDFRAWITKQSFKQFTLRKEGIAFSTPYSSVYGRQQVTLSYRILKPYLKPGVWNDLEAEG